VNVGTYASSYTTSNSQYQKSNHNAEQASVIVPNQTYSIPQPESAPLHPYRTIPAHYYPRDNSISIPTPSSTPNSSQYIRPTSNSNSDPTFFNSSSPSSVMQVILNPEWAKERGRVFDATRGSF
jgi:hypothetical protein